jgi:hypothetical protein
VKAQRANGAADRERPPTAGELYAAITAAINHDPRSLLPPPPFAGRYHIWLTPDGTRLVLREDEGQVIRLATADDLAADILTYAHEICLPISYRYALTQEQSISAAKFWAYATPPLGESPATVRWASDPGLCWRRLPWDRPEPADENQCPLFREMWARMSNNRFVLAWIGSLLDPGSDRQQYVWLRGPGFSGKSSLGRFLADVFGPACSAQHEAPDPKNQFWTSELIGRRLVIFPDFGQPSWPNSGKFKALTGDDSIRIERKYKEAYSAKLTCKFLFLTNEMPHINADRADLRRIILSEIAPVLGTPDPRYQAKLWQEGAHFLGRCCEVYDELTAGGTEILTPDQTDATTWAETVDEEYEVFTEKSFVMSDSSSITRRQLWNTMGGMKEWTRRDKIKYIQWLQDKYGIRKRATREGAKVFHAYHGIRQATQPGDADDAARDTPYL